LTAESDWIEGASCGFDTLLLRAARDVAFSVRASGNELIVTLSLSASRAGENGATERNSQKRLDILEARVQGETGQFGEALDGLHRMLAENPEDPDVLTALANLELQAGQWRQAEVLYNRALARMPGNEDVLEARARLVREQGSQVGRLPSNLLRRRSELCRHRCVAARGRHDQDVRRFPPPRRGVYPAHP
jgi:tetratricopeptide (TPR) repeat protein